MVSHLYSTTIDYSLGFKHLDWRSLLELSSLAVSSRSKHHLSSSVQYRRPDSVRYTSHFNRPPDRRLTRDPRASSARLDQFGPLSPSSTRLHSSPAPRRRFLLLLLPPSRQDSSTIGCLDSRPCLHRPHLRIPAVLKGLEFVRQSFVQIPVLSLAVPHQAELDQSTLPAGPASHRQSCIAATRFGAESPLGSSSGWKGSSLHTLCSLSRLSEGARQRSETYCVSCKCKAVDAHG